MNLRQAAAFLTLSRDEVRILIGEGIYLGGERVYLKGVLSESDCEISEQALTEFIEKCEEVDPGRHPPLPVRRRLLIESGYKCSVCRSDAPLQFHHILGWSNIRHHDERHMLTVCRICHDKITRTGQIDLTAQKLIKAELTGNSSISDVSQERQDAVKEYVDELRDLQPTVIDACDSERIVWVLPRGFILIEGA